MGSDSRFYQLDAQILYFNAFIIIIIIIIIIINIINVLQ
jgi:hypothetical protein